ncbi:MAG: DUF2214 domain-containing protein [Alphaproteobacteria bacterium]|nr:DUF2214 domain-containing protein [Alphaproteobacteria bacterium]MBU0830757.1 DUF2214 domain-containing protein [Alphaproteobacteria bacterium]MBU1766473.1 DUF2214 domain-containing protein [Alphaproteobacteria bacterium]
MEWLAILGESVVAQALIRSPVLYIFANAAHILSLAMLIGASVILDLRLLGRFKSLPLAASAELFSRIAAVALGCAVLTGSLLFSVRPVEYAGNTAFLIKLLLVGLGTANAVSVHLSRDWAEMIVAEEASLLLKLGAVFSLAIWLSAVLAGRWIGFL